MTSLHLQLSILQIRVLRAQILLHIRWLMARVGKLSQRHILMFKQASLVWMVIWTDCLMGRKPFGELIQRSGILMVMDFLMVKKSGWDQTQQICLISRSRVKVHRVICQY